MKRTLTFLMTALFLCMGMTVKAQTFPETSTAEAPKYYTIASFNRGGYLTNVGNGKGVEHVATAKGSIWYFTKADDNGGLHFCNFAGGYLAADKTISETAGTWYVLANGVNTDGVSISSTNPISSKSCIDANNYDTGVGAWHPSASDWHGTTWVFAEVTDFSVIFNVDEAKANAKAEIDVLASETAIYPDAASAKANIDAVQAEGTSAEQLLAAIDAVNQCVVDYKNAAYQALEGKYFTFATPARPNGFMKLEGNRVVGLAEASSPATVWQFVHADNAVKVFNPYTGKYLGEPGENSTDVPVTANAEDAAAYQLVINDKAEKAEAKVKFTSNGKSVHMSGGSVLVRWNDGGASEWTVAEISEFSGIASLHKAAALAAVEAYSALPEIFETAAAAKEAINAVSATDWSAFAAVDEAANKAIPTGTFAFQATSSDNHRDSVWVSANMETSKAIGAVEQDENAHWTLKPANGGAFYIYNVKNGLYMGNPGGNCALTESPVAAYTIEVIDAEKNVVEFKCAGETLHASNHDDDKLMNYDGDEAASRWTIVAIVEEPTPDPDPTPDPEEPEETVDLDMTHKVGTSKEAWHATGGPVTIDGVSMPEVFGWDASPLGDVMWQEIAGLENGKYTVELWANARLAHIGAVTENGQENCTYLFANNVEVTIPVYHDGGLANNKSWKLEGVEVTDGTLKMGMTKKAAGSNWHTIQIKSLTLHATNEVVVNIAKADLKVALDAANAVSPVTEALATAIAAAQAVYDNSNDKDEVVAATVALKTAIILANNTNAVSGASEENPVLTTFVVNGTFDAGKDPWKSTTGAQNQGLASNKQGAFTGNFFENWNGSNYTGKLYQVIENIPNGVYELSIAAFVETFDASAQFVYANADKVALTTGDPTAYKVRTIVKNNTIEVGFEQTAAVNRWCGIDNVSLTYLGEASNEAVVNAAKEAFTAAYAEFGVAMEACQAMMLKMSFYEIDDAAYQLNEQLETTTDVDALNAMAETLSEATASLKEINEVYAGYDVFVQKFKAAAEISEPTTTEAAELLEFNMYGGAGMQATSLEALAQAVETIKADYFTYIANANLLDGNKFDLTFMIQNPGFEMNLDGWTGVKANRIGGEGYDGVGGIAEIGEWGASSWDASMSQAITNLPNGKYIVKAAWMAASGIEMTFAANAGETTVTGIGDMGGNIAKDGSVVEMGQGHRGWQYVEVEGLVEDGTLTIAVSSSSAAEHMWSNADAFELYYAGTVVEEPEQPVVDPNDYTSYIINADLSTGDAWNTEGTKGISGGMVKVASESAFDFSQTITLPAGQYKMTAKAVYRYTGSEADEFAAIEAGTNTRLVNLYAETATYKYEAGVMNRYDGASDTDYAAGNGSVTVNGKFVPNSSSAVQAWFDNGQYVNELVFNVQEEGQVKIGLTRTGGISGDYTNISAWTLTRLGDAEADPEVEEPGETTDVDMTDKVNKNGWICENGKPNGVTIDGIAMQENFQDGQTSTSASTTGVVLWQDVTGLENGNYTVELWANARVAWQDSPATDGQEELTYLVANNVEISMKVFLNPGLNNNATYVLEGVEVTDGTLHIEMNKKAAGSNWHSIQIKSLTLHVSNNEALNLAKADLQAALESAAAVSPATDALTAAIAAAQNIYDNSKSVDEVNAAVASLNSAIVLAINTNSVAGATVAAPVVTNFVVNGTFDTNGVTAPWKTTTKAQNQTTATNQTGAFTGNFFENWNPSSYTGKIYQVIENIPNGLYELSICAFVNNFDASAQYVYANGEKKALVAGEPTAYTVRTTVADNKIEIGLEQITAVANWMGIDNVSLKFFGEVDENYAKDMYASTKAAAEALLNEKMSAEAKAALEAALAVEVDETSDEALIAAEAALQEVMATVKVSVNFFASNKVAIDAMFSLMESTNVYTAEAFAAYSAKAEDFLAQYEAGTLNATVDNPVAIHGWHASVDYDDLLLSAFGIAVDDWANLHVNTWSTEGETDGSDFKVPFYEYWTGDGESLGVATKTATITGLTPGMYYTVEAWVRVRAKNGVAATDATGITLSVGNGEAVDLTEGEVIGTSQFSHAVYTAYGYADAEGNLTINFNVLEGNNVSWLSFKNLKYAEAEAPAEPEYLTVVGAKVGDVALVEGAATVESISSFDITFDRPVALAEDAEWATLTDNWGDNSLKAEVLEDNNCVVRFSLQWEQVFTDAGDFYLYVPEGVVVDAENADIANTAIEAVITIEAAPVTPLAVTNVTVGEDVMEGFTVVATTQDMIKVNFDGEFYFQGMPSIVDAEGNDASEYFMFANGLDVDGSNSYILRGMNAGTYTITMPKASFLNMMQWKAPAEDIVLTVEVTFPDGIQNIEVDADAVIYDLSGRRVNVMTKGIYIVNGKKVIKK